MSTFYWATHQGYVGSMAQVPYPLVSSRDLPVALVFRQVLRHPINCASQNQTSAERGDFCYAVSNYMPSRLASACSSGCSALRNVSRQGETPALLHPSSGFWPIDAYLSRLVLATAENRRVKGRRLHAVAAEAQTVSREGELEIQTFSRPLSFTNWRFPLHVSSWLIHHSTSISSDL